MTREEMLIKAGEAKSKEENPMFRKEQIEKVKECRSVEEILAFAKENEVEVTKAEAEKYFSRLNPECGELADEELDNVAGGCGDKQKKCPSCGSEDVEPVTVLIGAPGQRAESKVIGTRCRKCRHEWR